MNSSRIKIKNYCSLFVGLLGGVLVNLPSALATPTKLVSSASLWSGIYSEKTYNNRLAVRHKSASKAAIIHSLTGKYTPKQPFLELSEYTLSGDIELTPSELLVEENPNTAIAVVNPKEGKVKVKLKNDTNTPIIYQVIEHTEKRYIQAREEITLQDLPTPVTITIRRDDGGFIKVIPKSKFSQEEVLSLSLDESKEFTDNQGALRIRRDGQVLFN